MSESMGIGWTQFGAIRPRRIGLLVLEQRMDNVAASFNHFARYPIYAQKNNGMRAAPPAYPKRPRPAVSRGLS